MAKMICGKQAHTHGQACKDDAGRITCGKQEHTHGSSCLIGD